MTDASPRLNPFSFAVFFSSDSPSVSVLHHPWELAGFSTTGQTRDMTLVLHNPISSVLVGTFYLSGTACVFKSKLLLPTFLPPVSWSTVLTLTDCMYLLWEAIGVVLIYINIEFVLLTLFFLLLISASLLSSPSLSFPLYLYWEWHENQWSNSVGRWFVSLTKSQLHNRIPCLLKHNPLAFST